MSNSTPIDAVICLPPDQQTTKPVIHLDPDRLDLPPRVPLAVNFDLNRAAGYARPYRAGDGSLHAALVINAPTLAQLRAIFADRPCYGAIAVHRHVGRVRLYAVGIVYHPPDPNQPPIPLTVPPSAEQAREAAAAVDVAAASLSLQPGDRVTFNGPGGPATGTVTGVWSDGTITACIGFGGYDPDPGAEQP